MPWGDGGLSAPGSSGGGGWGSGGISGPASTSAAKKKGGGSLVGNLLGDVGNAITGIPDVGKSVGSYLVHGTEAALTGNQAKLKQQNAKFVDPILHSYAHQYGPLTHGDFSTFYERFHEHPLGPILDALTLLSAGGSRAFALGTLPEKATGRQIGQAALRGRYQGPLRTISVQGAPGGAEIATRTLPRQGARAARMLATDKLLKALPPETRVFGEFARAARAVRATALPTELRHLYDSRYTDYLKAWQKLDRHERAAVAVLARVPLHKDLHAWKAQLPATQEGIKMRQLLDEPKLQEAYTNPHSGVMDALEKARAVSAAREEILLRTGAALPETFARTIWQHMQFARGARLAPDMAGLFKTAAGDVVRLRGRTGGKAIVDVLRDNGTLAERQMPLSRLGLPVTDPGEVPVLHRQKLGKTMVGAVDPEVLRSEVQAAGRPQPFYLPDEALKERGFLGFSRSSSGRTPPRASADLYRSGGVLFRNGMLALHPDVLGPAFLRSAHHDFKHDLYEHAKQLAVPVDYLPAGWVFVRETRGQHIPYTAGARGEHLSEVEKAFPNVSDEELAKPLTTTEKTEAALSEDGRYLAVPGPFARQLEGEWTKSSEFVKRFVDQPLSVWRALVLNLRIPWLVNNVLGNTMLATLRFAGPDGLRAFLGMVQETKGAKAVRDLLGDPQTRNHLTAEDIAAVYPELTRAGTFIGSQTADLGRVGKVAKRIGLGLAPLDAATESALRRAAAEAVLRGSDEVKAIYKAMPQQTRSWRAAMLKASKDPDLRRLVVREVNDALGNFLTLSPLERHGLRNVVPFWAWYREITRIALKMPVDVPGRTDLIARLGEVGQDESGAALEQVPSFLKGAIPLDVSAKGLQSVVNLGSANPLGSALQQGYALGGLTGLGPSRRGAQTALGEFNPFLAGGLTYLVNAAQGRSARGPGGAIPNLGYGIGANLPQVRVLTNPSSPLYPGRTRLDLLKQLFGDPRRRYDPNIARKYAGEGR